MWQLVHKSPPHGPGFKSHPAEKGFSQGQWAMKQSASIEILLISCWYTTLCNSFNGNTYFEEILQLPLIS